MTLRVMRDVVAGQPGDVAVGRIEAALDRLGADPGFARPLLSSGPPTAWAVTFAPTLALAYPLPPARPGWCPRTCRRRTG